MAERENHFVTIWSMQSIWEMVDFTGRPLERCVKALEDMGWEYDRYMDQFVLVDTEGLQERLTEWGEILSDSA